VFAAARSTPTSMPTMMTKATSKLAAALAGVALHDYEHFDCEIYILDVEKIEMRGDTILVHENIMKKLDGQLKTKQDAKKDQYGYNSHSSNYLVHYLTCFGFLLLICCRKTSNCFGGQESFTRDLQ
jgi:hypothetical protein